MAGPTAWLRKSIIDGVDPFIVATDFARGDGETDDTEALQAAIESAYGKLLYVPKGEYILSQNASTGYCLRIMDSVSILMEPGAILKLATSVPNTVNAIQIGDGSTAVSDVAIEGGVIDGDAVANGGSYSITPALIYASGPVQRVTIRNMVLRNALSTGLVIDGQSSESRAKHIAVEDCIITEVAEGVRFQKCDEFHMRGGSITKMMDQDGFEPHGALGGWSLRDCYIAEPHPSNSALEIFPQHGDIVGGLIENCTIVDDELRVSLSSGSSPESYEVRDVTVRGCYFKNSHVYAGVAGKYRNLTIEGCRFEGPSNCPRTVPNPKCGIATFGSNNRINVIRNKISGYQGLGLLIADNDSDIVGNEVFDNGQDSSLSTANKRAVRVLGNRCLISENRVYDTQEPATQNMLLDIRGTEHRVVGNHTYGNTAHSNKPAGGTISSGNRGIVDKMTFNLTIAAGATFSQASLSTLGLTLPAASALDKAIAQPMSDMAPATRYWLSANATWFLRINVDTAVSVDTTFRIHLDLWDQPGN